MQIHAVCYTCAKQHKMEFDPIVGPGAGFSDWLVKHPQHDIDFVFPRRSQKNKPVLHPWMNYLHNADIKTAYGASVAVTITLASLEASSTLLAGRESTAVDNGASNKYLDYLIAGRFKTAASNAQVGTINVAAVGNQDDTPTWPDVFDGTDSTETVSLQQVYDQICKMGASITTTATNALTWPFGPFSIGSLFGGIVPDQFVLFVSHSAETGSNVWSATEGDHAIKHTPIYATVT